MSQSVLYYFKSILFYHSQSLLTRIAESPEGAQVLLHGGALEKLAACSVLSLRPETDE